MSYTNCLDNPELYFQTKLYTGNGSTQSITFDGSENMQPDWVWIKCRSDADSSSICDSIRGANKHLRSDGTNAEIESGTVQLSSFDSNGFSLGSGDGQTNGSSRTYTSWNWLASNSTASNSNGSITSTVSANTTSGFSIVSWTGTGSNATVGHGLGSTPSMIIAKDRDGARNWTIYHKSLGATKWLQLDDTSASQTGSPMWQDTEPTSSLFSIGTYAQINTSSSKYIAYCFAEKKAFSKFGSYTGNGNADGTFVYTGFKPAFVIQKASSASSYDWVILDNKRDPFNVADESLYANLSSAVQTSNHTDFLSNGFKLRSTAAGNNGSGTTYIYMAFAENPFVTSTGVPATAR
jgi:hypothetical protein